MAASLARGECVKAVCGLGANKVSSADNITCGALRTRHDHALRGGHCRKRKFSQGKLSRMLSWTVSVVR